MHEENERLTPVAADVSQSADPAKDTASADVPPPLEGVNELFAVASFQPTTSFRVFPLLDDAITSAAYARERRDGDHVVGRYRYVGEVRFDYAEPQRKTVAHASIAPLEDVEREHILRAVSACGTMTDAAAALGIDRRTLYRKMAEYRRGPIALADDGDRR